MWTLAFGHHEDRTPTHGYEASREAAMAAFDIIPRGARCKNLRRSRAATSVLPKLSDLGVTKMQSSRWQARGEWQKGTGDAGKLPRSRVVTSVAPKLPELDHLDRILR
jgi:hypothetical protein